MERIADIIPSGNGGINGESRTLKEICAKPVPEHLIKKLDEERLIPEVVSRMKADLARMGSSRVPQPAQNGHVDFSTIAWRTRCKKPGRPSLVHMDCNYHSTDYITKDSCQSKSHYCKLYL